MKAAPWTEVISLADARRSAEPYRLAADTAARSRISKALDLASLDLLEAEITATDWMDGARLDGRWRAQGAQTCGVTLDPLPVTLEGGFTVRVLPPDSPNAPGDYDSAVAVDLDADDPPDVLEADERIDLAALVVEHLSLELDPFPRAEGAAFTPPDAGPEPTPFAALAQLKRRDDGDA